MSRVIPCDYRSRAIWRNPQGLAGSFQPEGRIVPAYKRARGIRANPRSFFDDHDTYSARLFVGFNVGTEAVYNMDDLIKVVKRVRLRQIGTPDSSFLYQKGLFKHTAQGTLRGKVIIENSAQVIILNLPYKVTKGEHKGQYRLLPFKTFERHMEKLAEEICRSLHQEEVIIQMQKNGVVMHTIGMTA